MKKLKAGTANVAHRISEAIELAPVRSLNWMGKLFGVEEKKGSAWLLDVEASFEGYRVSGERRKMPRMGPHCGFFAP